MAQSRPRWRTSFGRQTLPSIRALHCGQWLSGLVLHIHLRLAVSVHDINEAQVKALVHALCSIDPLC